jgi:WYL domain
MTIEHELRVAIAARRVVGLRYDGDAHAERVVHPHALFTSAAGTLCLDAFQVGGHTSSGQLPESRQFRIGSIGAVEPLGERFEPAPGWNRDSSRYRAGLVCCV